MEISKPKPWHGWREFLKELGTIVLGILMALGLEQLVSQAHDRHAAAAARDSIKQEIADDFVRLDRRTNLQGCIDRRLDEIAGLLAAAGKPGYRPPAWIGRPPWWEADSNRWQAATQAGRVSLFSPGEQSILSGVYEDLRGVDDLQSVEQRDWAQLRALENDPHPSPELLASLRLALQEARFQNWAIRVSVGQAEDISSPLHLPQSKDVFASESASRSVCVRMDTPRPEAVVLSHGDRRGEP